MEHYGIASEKHYYSAWIVFWCIVGCIILCCFGSIVEASEVSIGYKEILCKPIDACAVLDIQHEKKLGFVGISGGLEGYKTYINGIPAGELWSLTPYISSRVYIKNLYISGGLGYSFLNSGDYDVDDEVMRFIGIGLNHKDLSLEVRRTFQDLDIETGLGYDNPIEAYSKLNSVTVLLKWRF